MWSGRYSIIWQVKSKYRKDIQALRGIAVTAVVAFHANENIFPLGYLGVDVFFVISGFVVTPLIMQIISDTTSTPREVLTKLKDFYLRRFFRLAPALGVTLICSILLILMVAPVSEYLRFAKQGLASLGLLGNLGAYFYSGSNYFSPNPNPLIHLWSLSAEEQIYLTLPALFALVFLSKKKRKFANPIILISSLGLLAFAVDLLLVLNPRILQSFGVSNPQSLMFYLPVSRLYEFAFGALLYLLSLKKLINHRLFTFAGILVLTCLVVLLFGRQELAIFQSLIISSLTALVILFKPLYAIPSFLRNLGGLLGDSSYSIYLVHMPLIYAARYSPILNDRQRGIEVIVAVLLSFILGFASFKYVEVRFRNPQLENIKKAQLKNLRVVMLLFIPGIIFAGIVLAADSSYWGKDPNGVGPVMAIIEKCGKGEETACSNHVEGSVGEAILIGDSHAQALSMAFITAAQAVHFTSYVFAKSGCQYITQSSVDLKQARILGFNSKSIGDSVSSTCFQHNEAIRKWVYSHPDAVIFIANRSSSFIPQGISSSEYREILVKNAKGLKTATNQIVFIGPNPEFPDGTQYFSGNLTIWQKSYLPYEKLPRSKMRIQPFQDDQFFETNLPLIGIKFISSIGTFCTSEECDRKDGIHWLYGAKGHLSVDGANKFIQLLIESITL